LLINSGKNIKLKLQIKNSCDKRTKYNIQIDSNKMSLTNQSLDN